jgi:hypothetical protein
MTGSNRWRVGQQWGRHVGLRAPTKGHLVFHPTLGLPLLRPLPALARAPALAKIRPSCAAKCKPLTNRLPCSKLLSGGQ